MMLGIRGCPKSGWYGLVVQGSGRLRGGPEGGAREVQRGVRRHQHGEQRAVHHQDFEAGEEEEGAVRGIVGIQGLVWWWIGAHGWGVECVGGRIERGDFSCMGVCGWRVVRSRERSRFCRICAEGRTS